MLNIKRKAAPVTHIAAIAILSFGLVATRIPSSFAGPAPQSSISSRAPVQTWYPARTNRLEMAYPDLARKFGSNPNYWPHEAFSGIDCDLPSTGCPSTESIGQ